jgi:hypothetical protein
MEREENPEGNSRVCFQDELKFMKRHFVQGLENLGIIKRTREKKKKFFLISRIIFLLTLRVPSLS